MPTVRQGSFNEAVTNVAVNYAVKQADHWSNKIAPIVEVTAERGTYKVFNKGDIFRDEMMPRADGTQAAVVNFGATDATYALDEWALAYELTDRQRKMYPKEGAAEEMVASTLQGKAIISADRQAAAALLTAGVVNWGDEIVGVASGAS